ncbi:hypothetical protein M3223_07545 [Paenibacillus pasadenensis]|uniref:hypothetical protein n=1 Tax=Paenibacillus pasadenensis TaxID=217090 RepID=UPI00203AC20E|nr:hypothetical protein [Paenibacillus pasadenensis]MCM3747207.1 hypothetical protein [Paenibacillus pasadenensis]
MKKELPIMIPPVIGLLHHAHPLAILLNYDEYKPVYLCNYIQLYSHYNLVNDGFKIDFYSYDGIGSFYPFMQQSFTMQRTALNVTNIIDFIVSHIDSNIYVEAYTDENYLSNKLSYNLQPFVHQNLIYGYDLEAKELYAIGFDQNRMFAKLTFPFDEFIDSYLLGDHACVSLIRSNFDKIGKMTNTDFIYSAYKEFNLKQFIQYAQDYLECKTSFASHQSAAQVRYGLDVYDDYMEKLQHEVHIRREVKPLHMLWEHKKCMIERIQYLESCGYLPGDTNLVAEFEKMKTDLLILRNTLVKRLVKDAEIDVPDFCFKLGEIRSKEKELFEELLTLLSNKENVLEPLSY